MRARWRRNAPERGVARTRRAVLRPARRARRSGTEAAASGGFGRAAGRQHRRRSYYVAAVVGNRQQRFQAIQCVQRLARGHAIRVPGRPSRRCSGSSSSAVGRRFLGGGARRTAAVRRAARRRPAGRHVSPAKPAVTRRGAPPARARRRAPRRARPRSVRRRPRPPRAGKPRCPSIPSPAWCAASAAAADPPVRQVHGNVWRKWCGSGSPSAAPPAPPRRSPGHPASRCRGRSRPPRPASAGRPGAGWRRSRSSRP